MRTSAGILAALAACLSQAAFAEPIERISPSDGIASIRIIANVRETAIHVTFVEDMIPLGGGHGEFPVSLEGPGSCNWGWRGPRTLSCLLGEEDHLPLAERYALVIEQGLTAISGNEVPPFRLEFETDKPTVNYSNIDWDSPTSPVIYVYTNVPVSTKELKRRLTLEPLDQTAASVRVEVGPDPDPVEYLSEDLQFAIRPSASLDADTPYVVRVADGLSGIGSGLAGSAHDAGSFRSHAGFEFLGVGCGPHAEQSYWEHQHPITIPDEPDCAPEQPVALLFSAEPEIVGLYGVLTDAGLPPRIARTLEVAPMSYERANMAYYQATKIIYALRLGDFPAGASNSVKLPATIEDRFGRGLAPATATFPTRDFVPAFLDHMTLGVIASGSGDGMELATVNSDAVAARLHKDEPPGVVLLSLETGSPGVNERGKAVLNVEKELGKPWGVLVGEVAITHGVLANKQALRGFPLQYAQSVGAILSPWDVIVAAKGFGLMQRHSIWVSDLETGEAVTGVTVELLEPPGSRQDGDSSLAAAYRTGNVLGTARTDDDGFAEIFPTPNMPTNSYPSMVRVTKGDTVVVLPIEVYQFAHNVRESPLYRRSTYYPDVGYPGEGAVITWGVTDKPLYRTGETVRVKGYVRIRDDNRLVVPGQKDDWELNCAAFSIDLCTGRTVDLDDYGAFDATITLPESVIDGEYRVSVQSGLGGVAALSFRVANYKPKPHRVLVQLDDDSIVGDDAIQLSASAEYFVGGGVKNAKAQVFVETRSDEPPVPEPMLEDYYFGSTRRYWEQSVQSVSEAEFDDSGRLTGSFPLPPDSPASGVATVTVAALHDGGEWAFSNPKTVEYVQKPYVLGLAQKEDLVAAGEPHEAGVILKTLGGADDANLIVVQTLEYPSYRYSQKKQSPPDVGAECTVGVRADIPATCDLVPTRVGRAVIRARLLRDGDEVLEVERDITVATSRQRPWYSRKSDRLSLELQVEELAASETAEIIVDIPYDRASVLFSTHRNFIFDQWRKVLPRGENRVRIPLTEKHAPGFTITAIARPVGSDAGTSIGSAAVKVRSAIEVPTLAIDTGREDYKTGEKVRLTVTSSASGVTQLAVAVIDEAVLDLVPDVDDLFDPQGDRLARLLEMWGNFRWWQLSRGMEAGGSPGTSLEEITVSGNRVSHLAGISSQSAMLSAAGDPASGSGGAPLRTRFVEAAYFNPNVMTSDGGVAEIDFTVPDNLGKWRVVVIGADTGGQLFANTDAISVALPLEVRGELPTRLIAGDSVQPSASVLNRKPEASDITLSVVVDAGKGSIARETKTSMLDSMESFSVSVAVGPVAGSEIRLTATAKDSEDNDGFFISTPVHDYVGSRSWTSIAPVSANSASSQPIELPVNALEPSAELRVSLDKSVIGDLSQTFHYMGQTNHRNWEQILSRAVVAAYASSWDEAGSYRVSKEEMLNQLMQGSNFQIASGGMNHFEPRGDHANDYLSAYTVLALGWIEGQGFEVPAYRQRLVWYVYERANLGLRDRRTSYRVMDIPSTRDMPVMLAALSASNYRAGHFADQLSQYLRSNLDEFDVDGLAYALITATNIDAEPDLRSDLSAMLQARLVETFDRTEISGGQFRFGNRNELYCVVLTALQAAKEYAPEARALAKLVRGGYEFRDENSGFGNSHANALCVAAMTSYRDAFEAPNEEISARVVVPRLDPFVVNVDADEDSKSSDVVSLPIAGRRAEVSVTLTDGSSGYASTNVRYEVDLSKEIERSRGYTIKRSYSVYQQNTWRQLGADTLIKQGEWVRVDLDVVTPVVRRFVAITDPTPAGLEPVDRSLVPAVPGGTTRRPWWGTAFNQQALSNVRSRFYAEWLSAGSHRVTYYAQAKFAGEFMALPAKVESMYSDGVFAITAPATVQVEAGK